MRELIVDSFAGGGGASTGIEMALGRSPDIAVNHDRLALAMHRVNHPRTRHMLQDVATVDAVGMCEGRPIGMLWMSPDCTDHSKAKGAAPRRDGETTTRGIGWAIFGWVKKLPKWQMPRVIFLENVEEYVDWGPLLANGKRCPKRKGETFKAFVEAWRALGYVVEWRDDRRAWWSGSATIRKRLFMVMRRDGEPIVWPERRYGDAELVNLFRVLRGPDAARLGEHLALTPFARAEFTAAYELSDDPVEQARRLIVRSLMGFGNTGALGRSTGFRADSNKSGTTPAHDWANYPGLLPAIVARLAGVVIESRDAVAVMRSHDRVETLHYVDPPYVHETRSGGNPYCAKHKYRHEMTDADHVALLEALLDLKGMVVLSGYPSPLYDKQLDGWLRVERAALADGARERTEVLWINPACAAALECEKAGAGAPLFEYREAAE